MTSTLITRQPKGIPVGGQFAPTEHGESGVSLGSAGEALLTEEGILEAAASHDGPGVVPGVRRRIAETATDAGRQLFLQRCDAMYNSDSPYRIDRSMGYGPTPEQCDALAALGYESVNDVAPGKLKNLRGIETIITGDIEPERLDVIGKLRHHEHQWSSWEREAYLTAPLDRLDAVLSDTDMTRAEKYTATVDLNGFPLKTRRVRQALDMKIGDRGLIEADGHSLEVIADLRSALPDSKRAVSHVVGLADKGITGNHLRTYGSKACERFTAKELDESLVAPKTIRSYLGAGFNPSLEDMKTLHDAGYTSGNDLKSASQVLKTTDPKVLAAARKHTTGAQMAVFSTATGNKLRHDDPKAIGRLNKLGIDHPDQLRPWVAAIHSRANAFINRDQSILAIHADVIKSGITQERLGAMTRAGIPVTEAGKYKDTQDLWSAGAEYRAAWDADQANKVERRWEREVTPWAFTEATYRDGAAE